MAPIVSFVIATHERPSSLVRAINSVIAQGSEAELIVIADEGSRETRAAAAGALRETDIFLSYPGVRGPSESRNLGCKMARGSWLCFLDDDDTITPDCLEQIKSHLQPGNVIYGNYTLVKDNTDLTFGETKRSWLGEKSLESIEVRNFIPVGAYFVPAELARRVAFDTHLPSHEDWDYLLKLYALAPFHYADVWGFRYHHAPGPSRNNMKREERRLAFLSIYRRHQAKTTHTKRKRSQCLAKMGMELGERFL